VDQAATVSAIARPTTLHCAPTSGSYSHVLPGLQAEAAKRMDEAIGIGCQNGCQDEDGASTAPQESQNSGEKVVKFRELEPHSQMADPA
jgi:hypothetical protein